MFQWKDDLVYENNTGILKNHWTKHRLVCAYLAAFFMLISNHDNKIISTVLKIAVSAFDGRCIRTTETPSCYLPAVVVAVSPDSPDAK